MKPETTHKIEKFLNRAVYTRDCVNRRQADASRDVLLQQATELTALRDAVEVKLETVWDWLRDNPDADAFDDRETIAIRWLGDYEQLCDALQQGLSIFVGDIRDDLEQAA